MFVKLYSLLALLADVLFCFFSGVLNQWYDFWIPFVLFIAAFLGLIVLHLFISAVASLFINKKKPIDKPSKLHRWWAEHTTDIILFFCRIRVVVSNAQKIPKDRRFLMVSNHLSGLDPIVSMSVFKNLDISFISKPENFKIPVVAPFIHKCGFLAIDRENARNAMKTVHKATDYVKNDVCSVFVYPEGTRSKTGELLEFKDGIFYISKKASCPIVVLTIKNTDKVAKNFPFKSTRVEVDVHSVIEPEEFSQQTTHLLSEKVRQIMLSALANL